MAWFGRGRGGQAGPWPGRGPFSYLPPWQRPGWRFGRGACWRFLAPYLLDQYSYPPAGQMPQYQEYLRTQAPIPPTAVSPMAPVPSMGPPLTKEQEEEMLEQQIKGIELQLEATRKRIDELRKSS